MKTIGIVAHSFEGAALCFLTACHEGAVHLGTHMHPNIVMSAVPLGLSMPGWEANDYSAVGKFLAQGVQQVADAGADLMFARTIQRISRWSRLLPTCRYPDCTSRRWFATK